MLKRRVRTVCLRHVSNVAVAALLVAAAPAVGSSSDENRGEGKSHGGHEDEGHCEDGEDGHHDSDHDHDCCGHDDDHHPANGDKFLGISDLTAAPVVGSLGAVLGATIQAKKMPESESRRSTFKLRWNFEILRNHSCAGIRTLSGESPLTAPGTFRPTAAWDGKDASGRAVTTSNLRFRVVAQIVHKNPAQEKVLRELRSDCAPVGGGALNKAPVANAGADQTAYVGDLVQLDGTSSSDPDGDGLTFAWSFSAMPAGSMVALSIPTAATPTWTPDLPGTYTLQLVVNDGLVDSAPASMVVVATINQPPVIVVATSLGVVAGQLAQLDASGSYDPEQVALVYNWNLVLAPTGSVATLSDAAASTPTLPTDLPGSYFVELTVSDGRQWTAPVQVVVTASQPNRAPVGVADTFSMDENTTLTGNVLANDIDPDGDALTAVLVATTSHGSLALDLNGSFNYTPATNFSGTDSFTYQATDVSLNSAPTVVTITIRHVNRPPIANAGPDQSAYPGDLVYLDGSGSTDPDSDVLTFAWSFASKPSGSVATLSDTHAAAPTWTPDLLGSYTLQLVVNDGVVDSAPDSVLITAAIMNHPPVAEDATLTIAGDAPVFVVLRASDPDGDPLEFTVVSAPVFGTLSGTAPALLYTPDPLAVGLVTFTYIVSDGRGGTATGTVSLHSRVCGDVTGQIAYFPFNGNVRDFSGLGNDGVNFNAAPWDDMRGTPNSAFYFNGTYSYISVTPGVSSQLTGSFSASFWVMNKDDFQVDGTPNIVVAQGATLPYWFQWPDLTLSLLSDGRYYFLLSTTHGAFGVASVSTHLSGEYHHVGIVYDSAASLMSLYIDGVHAGSAVARGALADPASPMMLGGRDTRDGYWNWRGVIDEARLFNRPLAANEIEQLYFDCPTTSTTLDRAPTITSMPLTISAVGAVYVYQVVAGDPDGDPLSYTLLSAPGGMSVDERGVIRWIPGLDQTNSSKVTVQVSDPYGGFDTQTFVLLPSADNPDLNKQPPLAHAGDDFTVEEGQLDHLDATASWDADGGHLRFGWSQIAGPAVTLSNTHAVQPAFAAPEVTTNTLLSFTVTVSDGTSSSSDTINVMVLNADVDPNGIVTNSNPAGPGSFDAALRYANSHPGTRITFNIPVSDPNFGLHTSGVAWVPGPFGTNTAYGPSGAWIIGTGTTIDGTSQTTNLGDLNPFGPEVEIDTSATALSGLILDADYVVITGIAIDRIGLATPLINIQGGSNIVLFGNYIGTDATGMAGFTLMGDGWSEEAINVAGGYGLSGLPIQNLRIGGSRPGEGNIIFRFEEGGVIIYDAPTSRSVTIQGNYFGVDRTGAGLLTMARNSIPSSNGGTAINFGGNISALVGGVTPGSRNVIAGYGQGIVISSSNPLDRSQIVVQGNYIGTDATGQVPLNRYGVGVYVQSFGLVASPRKVLIGGPHPGARNVISGFQNGIRADVPAIIQGNYIGTDASGTRAIGVMEVGILTAEGVVVGGSRPGEGNVIGGCTHFGINASYFSSSIFEGNFIGVGADGVTPVPNYLGVGAMNGPVLGGETSGAGNTIAFNTGYGVRNYSSNE